jgi:hypothetical protein
MSSITLILNSYSLKSLYTMITGNYTVEVPISHFYTINGNYLGAGYAECCGGGDLLG